MSRLGYWCKVCGCFRENIPDTVTWHILAAKGNLWTEGQNPFDGGPCLHFATFEEVKKRKRRYAIAKDYDTRAVVNYS